MSPESSQSDDLGRMSDEESRARRIVLISELVNTSGEGTSLEEEDPLASVMRLVTYCLQEEGGSRKKGEETANEVLDFLLKNGLIAEEKYWFTKEHLKELIREYGEYD